MQLTLILTRQRLAMIFIVVAMTGAVPVAASEGQRPITEIVVFGRSINLVGQASAATEGTIGGADLLIRPLFKTAEMLESLPGMIAVQHSGSGKANQYFLRGFNLDHGTDYTVRIDGMPMNLRSHGHGQGYLDVNGLIPESVERIDYRKGPYRADVGDFALAGASFIHTIDRVERDFLSAETGEHGWRRFAGGMTRDAGEGTLTLVGEFKNYDGPWEQPEDLEHISIWGKYLRDTALGNLEVMVSGYEADWQPTEQIPERAIGTDACEDAFCALDPTAKGTTSRWMANAELVNSDWEANLFIQHYDWEMSSNPTYDFQIRQFDERWIAGGRVARTLIDNDTIELVGGGSFRYDDASRVGVEHTRAEQFIANIGANEISEGSASAFAEGTWYASDRLRLFGGLRGDYYDFDVTALNALAEAGQDSDARVSPKIGAAWMATRDIEFYANWGKGFHSNDARGVVNETAPVPALSPGTGYEVGTRMAIGNLRVTGTYWWLDQDSELIFVGDSNSVEPKGGSEREGLELTLFWQAVDWLGIDAVFTDSKARYTDNPDGAYVEQAVEQAAQLGISTTRENWEASIRVRYLGPYALVADNSRRAGSLTTINLRGAWHWNDLTFYGEITNLADSDSKEITYYYPAYVEDIDPAGLTSEDINCEQVDCTMSRASVPRTVRVGVSYHF